MYELRIELQSNLCASSGDGFATTIDTDIVADCLGIPYIPARRLKGCLREAAVYIYGEGAIVDKIFGVSGDRTTGSLRLDNAMIEDYETFSKMCVENRLCASQVTDLFTDTQASTAIEISGSAKENTLRFTRYVSKFKAWSSNENLVFCADVEIDDSDKVVFERICKALRHIGYKRNRGFGSVRCRLVPKTAGKPSLDIPNDIDDNKDYVITYAVRLDESLMLPSQSADQTADYISGQAVVGALAGMYLRTHIADETFDELFLSGNVRFSNLYITNEVFQPFVPVPQIFGKTKQSDRVIDLTVTERGTEIVKPLKTGYISADLEVKKGLTERVYHNALHDPDGGLYVQSCLQEGQLFMGTISAKGINIRTIADLLMSGKLSFGRSKTAQYSRCTLVGLDVSFATPRKLHLHKNDKVIYLFESDALISDDYGGITTSVTDVCRSLGIDSNDLQPESGLKYKMISGYLSVMRMQRTHLKAIAAGSALVINCTKDTEVDEIMYVGGRQNEGYGKVHIFKAGELMKGDAPVLIAPDAEVSDEHSDIRNMFVMLEKDEKMRNAAISYALEKKTSFLNNLGAAFIGRITMMLEQSDTESDFGRRIASIKSDSKRKLADSFIKDAANKWESNPQYKTWEKKREYLFIILTLAKYFHKSHKGGATQ